MTPQKDGAGRTQRLILVIAIAAALFCLVLWLFVPRPLVTAEAEFVSDTPVTIWRGSESELCALDQATGEAVLRAMGRYSAIPAPFMSDYPREMSAIPFELELTCLDGGRVKHIVLGKDFFWYRSAGQLYYAVHNGSALLDEITALTGITP